jgi:Holliday junction resolvase RusA-like endonuclease
MMHKKILPDIRPDDDNYTYILSNAASGAFYDDDKRRVESHVYKYYEDEFGPRTEVLVEPIELEE